jgi:site-specific recombinase XerD
MINKLEQFLNHKEKLEGLSKKSIFDYRHNINKFLDFIKSQNKNDVKDITKNDIEDYLTSLQVTNSSKITILMAIRSFFKYLYEHDIVQKDVAVTIKKPRCDSKVIKPLSLEQATKIKRTAIKLGNLRNVCIVTLFLNCGLRLSELAGVKFTNIHGDELIIEGKGGKERVVYLNEACQTAIKNYVEKSNLTIYLFPSSHKIGEHINKITIYKVVKDLGKVAKIKVHPHQLRHSFATNQYKDQKDIKLLQELLGHSSISVTARYTHVYSNDKKVAFNSINI